MYHVKVLKAADAEAAGRLAADQLQQAVCAKPACVLGLATGATPIPLYRELIRREQAGLMDFSRVRSVNLDEYKGLAPDIPRATAASCRRTCSTTSPSGRRTPGYRTA